MINNEENEKWKKPNRDSYYLYHSKIIKVVESIHESNLIQSHNYIRRKIIIQKIVKSITF